MNKRKINLSYIAGLFDGEGCITTSKVMKYNPTMKKSYLCNAIRMELCNTDFGLVDICYQFFKAQQRWQLTHRQAYRVLKKLLPYLNNKDKIEKGEKIINYYEVEQKI